MGSETIYKKIENCGCIEIGKMFSMSLTIDIIHVQCENCKKKLVITVKEDISPQSKYYKKNRDEILSKQRIFDNSNKNEKKEYYNKNKEHIKRKSKERYMRLKMSKEEKIVKEEIEKDIEESYKDDIEFKLNLN